MKDEVADSIILHHTNRDSSGTITFDEFKTVFSNAINAGSDTIRTLGVAHTRLSDILFLEAKEARPARQESRVPSKNTC